MNNKSEIIKILLYELTRKDILNKIDPDFYHHSKWTALLRNTAGGAKFISFVDGTMNFTYDSYRGTGQARQAPHWVSLSDSKYLVRIMLLGWYKMDFSKPLELKSMRRQILNDDIKIHCTCASFHYHYSYNAHKEDANIEAQTIPSPSRPDVPIYSPRRKEGPPRGFARNPPPPRGMPCKHLQIILETYPFWYSVIDNAIKEKVHNLMDKVQNNDSEIGLDEPSKVEIDNPYISDIESDVGENIANIINKGENDEGNSL